MSPFDLTEIRRQKDPVMKHVRVMPSATPGLVIVEIGNISNGLPRTEWLLSAARARMLAELLLDAAGRPEPHPKEPDEP